MTCVGRGWRAFLPWFSSSSSSSRNTTPEEGTHSTATVDLRMTAIQIDVEGATGRGASGYRDIFRLWYVLHLS